MSDQDTTTVLSSEKYNNIKDIIRPPNMAKHDISTVVIIIIIIIIIIITEYYYYYYV